MLDLLIYMIAMAITPGPNTILSMANASKVGLRKGIWLNIGMLLGITAVTAISYAAVHILSSLIPSSEIYLKAIGALYILYLAWKTYRRSAIGKEERSAGFIEGMVLQLVNVKVYLLAITAISSYIMPMDAVEAAKIALSSLIPLVCFICGLVWAAGGVVVSKVFSEHMKAVNTVLSLSLVYCAIRIFI